MSTLPAELKRNFILLRDLDDRTQGTSRPPPRSFFLFRHLHYLSFLGLCSRVCINAERTSDCRV